MPEQPSAITVAQRSISSLQSLRTRLVAEQMLLRRRINKIDQTIEKAKRVIAQHDSSSSNRPGRSAA